MGTSNLHKTIFRLFCCVLSLSCSKEEPNEAVPIQNLEIIGVDLSVTPALRIQNYPLIDPQDQPLEIVNHLKSKGVNTIRLRIWNLEEDLSIKKQFAQEIHQKGLNLYLSLHFSETWADPGQQQTPNSWTGINAQELGDSVEAFTAQIMKDFSPEFIQIGNEINTGFLHPIGHIDSTQNFHQLLSRGIRAVRSHNPFSKIILHFAGVSKAEYFYSSLDTIDFDIMGISYYPMWHGKNLDLIENELLQLESSFNRPWIIAETSYPFSLLWNDWTHNLLGESHQLADGYPATPQGQKEFIQRIKSILSVSQSGLGYCYWGGDWVSFMGPEAINGSPAENQALLTFQEKLFLL